MFWQGTNFTFVVTAAAPTFAVIVTEGQLEDVPNPTLIRQRGAGLIYANAGGATLDSMVGIGMYFADAQAIAAGIGSLQRPITDVSSDWIWHQFLPISDNSGTIDQIRPTTAAMRFEVDGKAMRKADANQGLVLVVQAADTGATLLNATVSIAMRLLFKK